MNPIKFKKLEVIPLSKTPAKVLVRWDIAPTQEPLNDYEFYVERNEAPDQIPSFQNVDIYGKQLPIPTPTTDSVNTQPISQAIAGNDFYEYVDYSGHLKNLFTHYYYRIRCRKKSTQEDVVSSMATWGGDLDVLGLYVVDEHNFLLEDVIGVPTFIYPRRRSGVPCTTCFDYVMKRRLYANCTECFGTNWRGGFYKPIDAFVDYSPTPNTAIIQEWGETQENESDVLVSNYPVLNPGDVLREIRENRLWRVVRVQQTEKRRSLMLQYVRVTEIKPSDIEYQLPYDAELGLQKIDQLERIKKLREF